MDRLLATLERRYGRHAPENITSWLVGLTGVFIGIGYFHPELLPWFWLDRNAVLRGEVWRCLTFLFAPGSPVTQFQLVLSIFALWLLYTMGTSLEAQWGSLRFDIFLLGGAVLMLAIGMLLGGIDGQWLASALFLAFAIEFPDYEILLFFILPIKVKWLGILTALGLVAVLVIGSLAARAAVLVVALDVWIFCGETLRARVRGLRPSRGRSKLSQFGPLPRSARTCAKCGRSEKDEPSLEFRVCDCQERCNGKPTTYCIEHARDH